MVADTKLYNALGVSPDASQDDIKKAYRKMALKWHPDKHPAEDRANAEKKFKEVSAAYDILSNEQKKKIYDMYGEKGLQAGGGEPGENPFGGAGGPTFVFREGTPGTHFQWTNEGPQGDAFRMFEQFFGGRNPFAFSSDDDFGGGFGSFGGFPFGGMGGRMGGGGGGLEEIFKMQSGFGQQGQRSKPKAKGNPQQVDLNCSLEDIYKGATKKMKVTRKRVRDGRVYDEPKVIEIKLKPGWKEGTKITFEGDGDQAVGGTPSDLVFVVKEKKHELFLREGDDLVYHAQIPRSQTREPHIIPFLDGSELKVHDGLRSIANDQQIRISGKGMPNSKTGKYGDLVVTFHLI